VLLEVDRLTAGYGPIIILQQVSLGLFNGEIVCIIGPNGAGKSTALRAVAGQITPLSGRIIFDGEDIAYQSVGEKARNGLIFIPQGDNIFPNLTVLENLEIAGSILQDSEKLRHAIEGVLEKFPMIKENKNHPARELSGGQRQILALCRILILRPRLVLLDEPSLGLAPILVNSIFQEIQEMNRGDLFHSGRAECPQRSVRFPQRLRSGTGQKQTHRHRPGAFEQQGCPTTLSGRIKEPRCPQ
jgi:branched-chain amino acid transport system ATP-binding protein